MFKHGFICERCVIVDLVEHKVVSTLKKVRWEKKLLWGKKAYPSLVRGMYSSIIDYSNKPPYYYFIKFTNREKQTVTPELISLLTKVPMANGGITKVEQSMPMEETKDITTHLCGEAIAWKGGNSLRSSNLK